MMSFPLASDVVIKISILQMKSFSKQFFGPQKNDSNFFSIEMRTGQCRIARFPTTHPHNLIRGTPGYKNLSYLKGLSRVLCRMLKKASFKSAHFPAYLIQNQISAGLDSRYTRENLEYTTKFRPLVRCCSVISWFSSGHRKIPE